MLANLVQLSDYVWSRSRTRLDGLTDEEYFWEPVAGCWSIRSDSNGVYQPDSGPPADPPPVTTIAWRLYHLVVCYGARRNREWLGLSAEGAADRFEVSAPAPASAIAALELLEAAHSEWDRVLQAMTDATLEERLGSIAGPFADADKAGFVLHQLDEFIHHGAEVALLRDLYRARAGSPD